MADKDDDSKDFEEELEDDEREEDTGVANGADGKDRGRGKDDKDGDEEDEGRGKRQRPNRRDRNTERLYGKMTSIEKGLGVLPQLLERLEKLESGQGDLRKASDVKPKLADFDEPEDYEAALEGWMERNPKTPKADDKDKGKDKGKGNDRNDTQDPDPEDIAKALGITLEEYEDFQDQVDEAREEHEDYDEVMAAGKSLLASAPKLARQLIDFGKYEGTNGPKLTYHLLESREGRKEFKRIAALSSKREMDKALEAVAEQLGEEPAADRKDSRDKEKDKGERRTFTPLNGRRAPSQKKRDESTMSDEDFFAEEEKKAGHR